MKSENSYLQRLVGKEVISIDTDISTVVAVKNNKADLSEEKMSIYIQLYFEDYRLEIFNRFELLPKDKFTLNDLKGLRVIAINETKEKAELIFNKGYILKIDMTDEAYNDPEAMGLYGPNNFWVVWN